MKIRQEQPRRIGVELKEYPKYLQNAGFTKVKVDTISGVPYAQIIII